MSQEIIRSKLPEELEYEKKINELNILEDTLAQLELELQSTKYEMKEFELNYMQTVGFCFARLDKIKAQIVEILSRLSPDDNNLKEEFQHAQATANESAQAVGDAQEELKTHRKISHGEDIKAIYRDLAKKFHPDLAIDDDDRQRRTKYMSEINEAYQNGDEERLKRIMQEFEESPDSVTGKGAGAELVRVIRKISQVQKRLNDIKTELEKIKQTEIFKLKQSFEKAQLSGRNLLGEMVKQIEEMIEREEKRLNALLLEVQKRQ